MCMHVRKRVHVCTLVRFISLGYFSVSVPFTRSLKRSPTSVKMFSHWCIPPFHPSGILLVSKQKKPIFAAATYKELLSK